MPINPTNLFHSTMHVDDGKQRVALVEYGRGFHIRHADISFTAAALARLTPLFAISNIDLATIRTLAELGTAYLAWRPAPKHALSKLLVLRKGHGCIPAHVSSTERLERQVLLTYAPYLDIRNVDIALNADGVAAVGAACNTLGISPQSITTLLKLAQLNPDLTGHALRAATTPTAPASTAPL